MQSLHRPMQQTRWNDEQIQPKVGIYTYTFSSGYELCCLRPYNSPNNLNFIIILDSSLLNIMPVFRPILLCECMCVRACDADVEIKHENWLMKTWRAVLRYVTANFATSFFCKLNQVGESIVHPRALCIMRGWSLAWKCELYRTKKPTEQNKTNRIRVRISILAITNPTTT